jgi:MFS family permease
MKNMKLNVWLLSFCQAMMNTGNVLLLSTSSLVGYHLADDKSLATLPLGLQFFSTMLMTIPASMLMKYIGRRLGFMTGVVLGLLGASLAAWAVWHASFELFCAGAVLIGAFNGFGTYYRFAAADVATLAYRPTAISYVMAGGVIAAIIGPNLANWTSGVFPGAEFAASYVAIAGLYILSMMALLMMTIPRPDVREVHDTGRPLREIVTQ